nr:MAG TPA: hypothetical protein [Caudoviricetes sp.]
MADVKTACRDIGELLPKAQEACNLFLERCKAAGINIFITETYRSQERQDYLYEQGRSRPGNIVTWTKNSRHTSRRAWDIACSGNNLYDMGILTKAGHLAQDLGLIWGGSWTTPDMPHIEMPEDWNGDSGEANEVRYNTIDELPEWAKDTIQNLINRGKIADRNNLDLSLDMVRILVIMNR